MEGSRPPTVLVVEDEPDLASLFREILEAEGFVVLVARDGAHALSILSACTVALIVTDLMMPVMDGFDFLRVFQAGPAPRAPVIATSALCDYLPKAIELGAAEAYEKTAVFAILPQRVRALLAGRPEPRPVIAPPAAGDESGRLRAILDLRLDQPPLGDALHAFTQQVARVFEVPVCLVSIVTCDRQYWTAFCGLPDDLAEARGTPREHSFCTHAVVARAALVVQDTVLNPFFQDNPLVRERGLRFYAGVPVTARTGEVLGTLCLLDFRPRTFTHFDLELLSVLAKRVMAEIDWREQKLRPDAPFSAFRYLTCFDEALGVLGREIFLDVLRVEACRALSRSEPLTVVVLATTELEMERAARALTTVFPRGLCGRLGVARLGMAVMGTPTSEAEELARAAFDAPAVIRAAEVVPPAHTVAARLEALEASLP
ncbi:MAG: response regulator [Minicystis sp.]